MSLARFMKSFAEAQNNATRISKSRPGRPDVLVYVRRGLHNRIISV